MVMLSLRKEFIFLNQFLKKIHAEYRMLRQHKRKIIDCMSGIHRCL